MTVKTIPPCSGPRGPAITSKESRLLSSTLLTLQAANQARQADYACNLIILFLYQDERTVKELNLPPMCGLVCCQESHPHLPVSSVRHSLSIARVSALRWS